MSSLLEQEPRISAPIHLLNRTSLLRLESNQVCWHKRVALQLAQMEASAKMASATARVLMEVPSAPRVSSYRDINLLTIFILYIELNIEKRTSYLMVALFTFCSFLGGLLSCGLLQMLIEKQYNAKKSNTDGGRGSDKSAVSIINQSINQSEPIARFFSGQK